MNWFSFSFLWSLHTILFWQPHCQQHQYAGAVNSIITINKNQSEDKHPHIMMISLIWLHERCLLFMNLRGMQTNIIHWFVIGLSDDDRHLCGFVYRPISSHNLFGPGLYPRNVALSQWIWRDWLYNDNHESMACQINRKDVASSYWLNTTLPPIMCSIGSPRLGVGDI